jgi:hypothetical protein
MIKPGFANFSGRTRPKSENTRASVEQNNIGVFRLVSQLYFLAGTHYVGDLVRVVLVHLATERFNK